MTRRPLRDLAATALAAAAALAAGAVGAAGGKLLLTGGVSGIEGAAGGGLTPWALTGTYATAGELGATAHVGGVKTRDYTLATAGAAISWDDRVEVSLAKQDFDARANLAALGLSGLHLEQHIVGVKLRLAGDAVLDSDSAVPQIAVGALYKRVDAGALAPTLSGPLGAKDRGVDLYLSATKLWLAEGVIVNLTLRSTRANQNGLLGFGGAQGGRRGLHPEVSVAYLVDRHTAFGVEFRAKPDHLDRSVLGAGALAEDDWYDVFVAWAPGKAFSLTIAWVDLGRIAPAFQPRRQQGAFVSAQIAF